MTYPHRIVGRDVAQYAADHGGASFHFQTGKPVPSPGFMVARDGSETVSAGDSPTPEEIQNFADKHAPSVANNPKAAHGVWGNIQDVSSRETTGAEMRLESRKNRQEAAYALGSVGGAPTRINPRMDTDTINRPYGAEVLTNLQPSGDAKGTRAFISMTANESDAWRHPRDRNFAPTGNQNDISLNEVENDSWSMTNRTNKRGGSGRGPTKRADGLKKRTDLGDVLRTINKGRTQSTRGINMTTHPTKGWHEDTNAQGQKVGPSKNRTNADDGVRSVVEHSPALASERGGFPYQATPSEFAEQMYQSAADMHRRLAPPRPPNTPPPPYDAVRQTVQKHFG